MAKRYEISDEAWTVVADLFTESHGRRRPCLSDRLIPYKLVRSLIAPNQ